MQLFYSEILLNIIKWPLNFLGRIMSFVYNTSKSKESLSHNSISVSETINFQNLKIFTGDAGKDPFFNLRMEAAVVAMAQFLDFMDQTETYQYYPLGLDVRNASYHGEYSGAHKEIVLQLAVHSYFFEKETHHPGTIFKKEDWVRATLNELDLWPKQFEVHYECFFTSQKILGKEPIYRRVEVSQIIQIYMKKLGKYCFNENKEWAHVWNLIMQEYQKA